MVKRLSVVPGNSGAAECRSKGPAWRLLRLPGSAFDMVRVLALMLSICRPDRYYESRLVKGTGVFGDAAP